MAVPHSECTWVWGGSRECWLLWSTWSISFIKLLNTELCIGTAIKTNVIQASSALYPVHLGIRRAVVPRRLPLRRKHTCSESIAFITKTTQINHTTRPKSEGLSYGYKLHEVGYITATKLLLDMLYCSSETRSYFMLFIPSTVEGLIHFSPNTTQLP
jgi:hypothetical protein